jgi:hypothetical protein
MSDDTQWYEIGFNGGEFNDRAVYKAFSDKVNTLIRNPPSSRRDFLNDTMRPEVKEVQTVVNQGNQYNLTKIDRFLGRTERPVPCTGLVTEHFDGPVPCTGLVTGPPEPEPELATREASAPEQCVSFEIKDRDMDQVLNGAIQNFKEQLRARLRESSSTSGFPPVSACPVNKRKDYAKLLAVINNDSPFVHGLVESLPNSTIGQRLLVSDFLHNFHPVKTETELADQLNLSPTDRALLKTYGIKLSDLL